jgi:hypothetical protein
MNGAQLAPSVIRQMQLSCPCVALDRHMVRYCKWTCAAVFRLLAHLGEGVLLLCIGDLGSRSQGPGPPAGARPGQLQQLIMRVSVQQLLAARGAVAVLLLAADPALDGWCWC